MTSTLKTLFTNTVFAPRHPLGWDPLPLDLFLIELPIYESGSQDMDDSFFGPMLTEFYIEALLIDEGLADQVWDAWNKGEIDDAAALFLWRGIALQRWRWMAERSLK